MENIFKKPSALIAILLITTLVIIFILSKSLVSIEKVGVFIAWLIGIFAILQIQIKEFFFPPLLEIRVEEVLTTTNGGWQEKWYNLVIKNCGFSTAKNIRIKIKDGEYKSWINLLRPFAGMREDKIYIHTLTVKEEEAFNIGHSDSRNGTFQLATNLTPNNQKMILNSEEHHTYFVNIVSDNIAPVFIKTSIDNPSYSSMSVSHITISKN